MEEDDYYKGLILESCEVMQRHIGYIIEWLEEGKTSEEIEDAYWEIDGARKSLEYTVDELQ